MSLSPLVQVLVMVELILGSFSTASCCGGSVIVHRWVLFGVVLRSSSGLSVVCVLWDLVILGILLVLSEKFCHHLGEGCTDQIYFCLFLFSRKKVRCVYVAFRLFNFVLCPRCIFVILIIVCLVCVTLDCVEFAIFIMFIAEVAKLFVINI